MVETVRHEAVRKPVQDLGDVSERANADCDDDTASAQLATVIKAYGKIVTTPSNRGNLNFRKPRNPTLLEFQT
jgi:carbamate kinase